MRAMVQAQVRKAFAKCGDLLVDVVLTPKVVGPYSMGDMSVILEDLQPVTIKAVFVQESQLRGAIAEVIFNSQDVPDMSIYVSAFVNGRSWKIIEPVIDDAYLTKVGLN